MRTIIIITIGFFWLMSCKSDDTQSKSNENINAGSSEEGNQDLSILDSCNNKNLSATLTKKSDKVAEIAINENDKLIKEEILNIPISSSINLCSSEYVVVGFSCGGPCYSQLFIFRDSIETKQFGYSQIVSNNENFVAYRENEDFNKVTIHNLKTEKEQIVLLEDFEPTLYGHIDSLWIKEDSIYLNYQTRNKGKSQKREQLSIL